MDLLNLTVKELAAGYRNRDFSVTEVTKKYLDQIEKNDEDLNAYITVTKELAIEMAQAADKLFQNREDLSLLAGIPISIKDNISLKDVKFTCASKFLENYISPFDSCICEKIKDNKMVILGKTNLDEFAMGASTRTSYFGVTKNPLDKTRVAGGSSGGSAASVAANEAVLSMGTDTGGSVRQPSSFCATVGMKPSYGSISRYGMATMANTFDQAGVIGKNVFDVSLMLKSLVGRDNRDATSIGNKSYIHEFAKDYSFKDVKIAIPKVYMDMQLDEEVKLEFERAIKIVEEAGAKIINPDMQSLKYVIETYHILANGEIAPNMARFDSVLYGHRAENYEDIWQMYKKSRAEGFGDEVKRRIMIGTHILSLELAKDYYYKALKVRGLIKREMDELFKEADFMMCPTVPILPFKIDEKLSPVEVYQSDMFTIPASMVGAPSISLPMPINKDGLSVGIEFCAKNFKDRDLINMAMEFERRVK